MRITSIDRPARKQKFEIRVDHTRVLHLSAEIVAQAQLQAGQEISAERMDSLQAAEARHSALSGALRLLAYRPRSEKEMRQALHRRGMTDEIAGETVARLRELRLLDDGDFARTYVEQRDRSSPRGRRMLLTELRSKGVTRPEIERSLESLDDADAAYRAAVKRARSLSKYPFADFQRRLSDHLLRRGFSYGTTRDAVNRVWVEHGQAERET